MEGGARPTEVYGFAFWVASFVALGALTAWAFVPETSLHSVGITYFPAKYWAIALPAYFMCGLCFYFVFYLAIAMMRTEPLSSRFCFEDERGLKGEGEDMLDDPNAAPPIADLPISTVNHLLFGTTLPSSNLPQ